MKRLVGMLVVMVALCGTACMAEKEKDLVLTRDEAVSILKCETTLLHKAAEQGLINTINRLIKAGADINAADESDRTPLHSATEKNQLNTVAFLTNDRGANVNTADKDHWTPLHEAAEGGYFEITVLLIKKGANVNTTNKKGQTPLDVAMKESSTRLIEFLRKKGGKTAEELKQQ